MGEPYAPIIAALWIAWLAYWAISAMAVKTVVHNEGWRSRVIHDAPLWLAAILLIGRGVPPVLGQRFLPDAVWLASLGVILIAAGLAFAVWARTALGGNWSAHVTVKHGHELVCSGPYALVRHPIYSGLILAFGGTAIAIGQWRGLVALVLAIASCWHKLRVEERLMVETFGAAYEDYRRRVKALVPFVL